MARSGCSWISRLYMSYTFLLLLTLALVSTHVWGRPMSSTEEDGVIIDPFFDSQKSPPFSEDEDERTIVRVIVTSSSSSSSSSSSYSNDEDPKQLHDFEISFKEKVGQSTSTPATTTIIPTPEYTKTDERKDVEDIFSAFYKAFAQNSHAAADASHNVEKFHIFYPPTINTPPPPPLQEENDGVQIISVSSSSSSFPQPLNHPGGETLPFVKPATHRSAPATSQPQTPRRRYRSRRRQRHKSTETNPPVIVSISSSASSISASGSGSTTVPKAWALVQPQKQAPILHQAQASSTTKATTPIPTEPPRVWGEPEKVWGEPARVWGEPAKVWGQPEKVWGVPEQNWSSSYSTTTSTPTPTTPSKPTTRTSRYILKSKLSPTKRAKSLKSTVPTGTPARDEDYPNDAPTSAEAYPRDNISSGGTFVILGEEDPEQDSIDGAFDHHLGIPRQSPRPISIDQFKTFNFSNHNTISNLNLTSLNHSQSSFNPSSPNATVFEVGPSGNGSSESGTKFGYVLEGNNVRRYRVEERTSDGFIVGEYGVLNNQNAFLRGVRYTADGTINPRLIHEALMKFLSLRR